MNLDARATSNYEPEGFPLNTSGRHDRNAMSQTFSDRLRLLLLGKTLGADGSTGGSTLAGDAVDGQVRCRTNPLIGGTTAGLIASLAEYGMITPSGSSRRFRGPGRGSLISPLLPLPMRGRSGLYRQLQQALDLVTRCRKHIETNKPGRSREFNRLIKERRAVDDALRELVGKQPDPGAPPREKLNFTRKRNRFESQWKSIEERVERAFHRLGEVNSCLVQVSSRVQLLAEDLQMPRRWAEALATANQHQSPDLRKLERLLTDMLQNLRAQPVEQTAALPLEQSAACPVVGGAMLRTQERHFPTPLAANIYRFMRECGWTYDKLAEETHINKRLILKHVNEGKGAYPRNLILYAKAFSRELRRTIAVEDLERPRP